MTTHLTLDTLKEQYILTLYPRCGRVRIEDKIMSSNKAVHDCKTSNLKQNTFEATSWTTRPIHKALTTGNQAKNYEYVS